MFNLKDHRGTDIEVGQRVAYNWQGQVAVGIITDIQMGNRYNRPYPRIKIKQSFPGQEKESVVTSDKNLIVVLNDERTA